MNPRFLSQRGEGEFGFLITAFGAAVALSVITLLLGWVKSVKEERMAGGRSAATTYSEPVSAEEFGSYEVKY